MKGKLDLSSVSSIFRRSFAAQQQAARQVSPKIDLVKGDFQRSILSNGIMVASVENLTPVAKISVMVRAGPRFETSKELGASHMIRYAAGMHTKNHTIFGITRNMEYSGGSMTVTTTRDDIIYRLTTSRETAEQNYSYLADTVTRPQFRFWQLEDYRYRLEHEIARAKVDPEQVMMEELHRIAFRGGLANPLYISSDRIHHIDSDTLMAYHDRMFRNKRIAVVGFGVDHKELCVFTQDLFESRDGIGPAHHKSKFIGGESRIVMEPERDLTYTVVVTEGVGSTNIKDVVALSVFQNILTPGVRVKYGSGAGKLHDAANKIAKDPFSVTPINISYMDTGLFGFSLACGAKESTHLVKAIVSRMRDAAKNIKEEDLKNAKHQAKAALWLNRECPSSLLERLGTSMLNDGSATTCNDIDKMIDSITAQDVSSLATKIMKSKGALVSVGNLDNMCYLEDLA
ncbi:ubiquinol-cytochrome c reductase core protein 2 [Brevipalpus obovatus]|uniref:ubiquinol-cytochrome c reductase core protein 2 n=1 Tax=Brevipalpus obovatus TaxID=246614 RepID=UPI003D9E21FF